MTDQHHRAPRQTIGDGQTEQQDAGGQEQVEGRNGRSPDDDERKVPVKPMTGLSVPDRRSDGNVQSGYDELAAGVSFGQVGVGDMSVADRYKCQSGCRIIRNRTRDGLHGDSSMPPRTCYPKKPILCTTPMLTRRISSYSPFIGVKMSSFSR